MSVRARWLLLLVLALLLRGMAGVQAHPLPVAAVPAAEHQALPLDCHAAGRADTMQSTPHAAGDEASQASPECKIACDMLLTAALLPPSAREGTAPAAVQVPVVPRLRLRDAPPPDRPPPIG